MTVLIIHGIHGHAGVHWQQWLHDELVKLGHRVIMPDMPEPKRPDRKTWLKTIQDLVKDINLSELVIVGHSLGVPTALDFLETIDQPIKALVSVSGFSDEYKAELNSYFMAEKEIDFQKVNQNLQQTFVLYGDNDPYVPQEGLSKLAKDLQVEPVIFPGGGHLNSDSDFSEFPELLEIFKQLNNDGQN